MSAFLDKLWYDKHPLRWFLLPLSWGYKLITLFRRWYLQHFCQILSSVPVIVVGNISVGGVGKTPLVIELANKIRQKGVSVGIVSRGYGAQITAFPHEVQLNDTAADVGDEPLMIAQKTRCPVVIAPHRADAVDYLIKNHQSQIIISDDGLQHYRMGRAVEIAVIDGMRGLGNGLCLPAGPLRESKKRLRQVDFIVVNEGVWQDAHPMKLYPGEIKNLANEVTISPDQIKGTLVALAAIGNPQRFYSTLTHLGIEFTPVSYPDHYQFTPEDLNFNGSPIIMTEKDAVKCRSFSSANWYYLPVHAVLDDAFWNALWSHQQLKGFC